MKRSACILLLAALLLLGLAACGDGAAAETAAPAESAGSTAAPAGETAAPTSTPAAQTGQPTGADTDAATMYAAVLESYRAAAANNYDVGGSYGSYEPNQNLLEAAQAYQENYGAFSVYYAFYDLNGDGVQELLVTGSDAREHIYGSDTAIDAYDVYAYDGLRPVLLVSAGYRTQLHLYQDGTLLLFGAMSASEYSYQFLSIDSSGAATVCSDEYTVTYTESQTEPLYSPGTKADFDAAIAACESAGRVSPDWRALTA